MIKSIVAVALVLSLAGTVFADSMFRCQSHSIVHKGDSTGSVLSECGSPAHAYETSGGGARYKEEVWIYTHGSNDDFQTALHFMAGTLVEIESMGRR